MGGNLRSGQLVKSTAGRDEGKYYLVLDAISTSWVLVVNGTERKVNCPKKKNVKHLKVFPVIAEEIENEFLSGKRVTNLEISRAIDTLIDLLEASFFQ